MPFYSPATAQQTNAERAFHRQGVHGGLERGFKSPPAIKVQDWTLTWCFYTAAGQKPNCSNLRHGYPADRRGKAPGARSGPQPRAWP